LLLGLDEPGQSVQEALAGKKLPLAGERKAAVELCSWPILCLCNTDYLGLGWSCDQR